MAATELSTTPLFTDANLVAYWKLENTSDSKASYTLTNNNSVGFASGLFNNAADFGTSNTNKYLSVASDLGITNGACSISAWIKLRTEISTGEYRFVWKFDTGTDVTYGLKYEYNSGTRRVLFWRVRENAEIKEVTYNTVLGTSNWHHMVLTHDGTTLSGYLDGVSVGTPITATGDGSGVATADFTEIGRGSTAGYASAYIDDVAIFNRALTSTEVSNLYNGFPAEGGFYYMSV